MSDLRAEILSWLAMMDRHHKGGGVWRDYALALAALRSEVSAHEEIAGPDGYCGYCGEDGHGAPTDWPCPTIARIYVATVGSI